MNKENNYYISQLQQKIEEQKERLASLEKKVKELQTQMRQVIQKPQTISYHFEQLRIDTLEGTLHIGMGHSAESKDFIEQFNVGQNTVQTPEAQKQGVLVNEDYREMIKSMDDFFVNEAPVYLKSLETKTNIQLDDTYRIFILDDVHRQVPGRIKHYLTKYKPADERGKNEILQRTKEDIYRGIETFIAHLRDSKSTGGSEDELPRNKS
jgi:spore germination protein PC